MDLSTHTSRRDRYPRHDALLSCPSPMGERGGVNTLRHHAATSTVELPLLGLQIRSVAGDQTRAAIPSNSTWRPSGLPAPASAMFEQRVLWLQNTFYPLELSRYQPPHVVMTGPMLPEVLQSRCVQG